MIPLIHFTNNRQRMGAFANRAWVRVLAWSAAVVILSLDIWLVTITIRDWLAASGRRRLWLELGLTPILILLTLLLVWVIFQPVLPPWIRRFGLAPIELPQAVADRSTQPAL